MKWTGLNELRETYLSFFEEKGHTRLPSFSLVPHGDKSLFLINSGMAPMKKYFLGQETPPSKRVTTCQKCIRTPDIENVGKTARHGTYFEMLGNFSFGDYFKHEAIRWAWEFCTDVLDLPVDRLWFSIYLDDEETFDIWTKEIGIPAERIVRLGKEDNFWEHGTGPSGPCSELHFDRGVESGCGSPDCAVGCDCDRFVEFWNLVFSQFDSDGKGTYTPLANPNIDTGMGLERLACIMQGVDNLFEVDTMQKIMKHISDIAGVTYKDDPKVDVSLRVITDHIRSTTFMIGDGVNPSNEGKGYVLRRLLRRAARHGRLLGVTRTFLSEVVATVIEENKSAYPDLVSKAEYIKKMVLSEEESFAKTIEKGFDMLNSLIENIESTQTDGSRILSGADAFKLYDTFGFPLDLTKEIVAEKDIDIDEEEFTRLMQEQRVRAKNARSTDDAFGFSDNIAGLENVTTEFVGYDCLTSNSKVSMISFEGEPVDSAISTQKVVIITDKTPFYAESGGQVGDKGIITTDKCKIDVYDVKKSAGLFIHSCKIIDGQINKSDDVFMQVDSKNRNAIMRNHTAAHLLQAALRNVLGEHIHQAGQLVSAERMRFDFSHFEALTPKQIKQVEREINEIILSGVEVKRYETDIKSAREKGAMALFGEKYGDIVRICEIGDYSMELCGGTHIDNSAKIGLFKIISESSVASGVRRIEAVTGYDVLVLLDNNVKMINEAAKELRLANPSELVSRSIQVMNELKEKTTEIDKLSQKIADNKIDSLLSGMKKANKVDFITAKLNDTKSESLRVLGDKIKEKAPNCVGLLIGSFEGKATMLCVCGSEAIKNGASAGKIVSKASAITGGKGGGRPDNAMAGVNDNSKIEQALSSAEQIINEITG